MAIEYTLTMSSDGSAEDVAARAVPDPQRRPTPTPSGRVLSTDLYDELGFLLTVRSDRNGYVEAEGDDGHLEWEPAAYVDVHFRMGDDRVDKGIPNMLTIVSRILDSGSEEAALVLNGDVLLLTRLDGMVRKHNRPTWWEHYGFVNDIIPG